MPNCRQTNHFISSIDESNGNISVSLRGMIKPGNAGLGATKPDEPLPGDDEFDVYRKRMMLAYKYRPNPMVCSNLQLFLLFKSM